MRTGKTGRADALAVSIAIFGSAAILAGDLAIGLVANLSGPPRVAGAVEILCRSLIGQARANAILARVGVAGVVGAGADRLHVTLAALEGVDVESFTRAATFAGE